MLGQIGYDEVPYVPPELMLVPPRFPFSLASMSSWTRTIIVPLMVISAFKPVKPPAARDRGSPNSSAEGDLPAPARKARIVAGLVGKLLPRSSTRLMKVAAEVVPGPVGLAEARRSGRAHRWMLDHFENSDGLGAIFPPMIYTVVALE